MIEEVKEVVGIPEEDLEWSSDHNVEFKRTMFLQASVKGLSTWWDNSDVPKNWTCEKDDIIRICLVPINISYFIVYVSTC